jgi:hypothetical protein
MFKKTFLLVAAMAAVSALPTYAASTDLQYDPSLKQATSCSEIETVLKDYLNSYRNADHFGPVGMGGAIMNTPETKDAVQSM